MNKHKMMNLVLIVKLDICAQMKKNKYFLLQISKFPNLILNNQFFKKIKTIHHNLK